MKFGYIISLFTVTVGLILSLIVSFWILYPYKEIEFKNNIAKVVNDDNEVESGGYLIYQIEYCKYSDNIPEITRHFVDGLIYTVPSEISVIQKVGCGNANIQIYIPKNLPKGTYYISSTYRFRVNPIRNIDYTITTEKFTVR